MEDFELKRCPFCGWNARVYKNRKLWYVECNICGAKTRGHVSEDHVRTHWNSRIEGDK